MQPKQELVTSRIADRRQPDAAGDQEHSRAPDAEADRARGCHRLGAAGRRRRPDRDVGRQQELGGRRDAPGRRGPRDLRRERRRRQDRRDLGRRDESGRESGDRRSRPRDGAGRARRATATKARRCSRSFTISRRMPSCTSRRPIGGPAVFAQNIRDLQAAGCTIIVDDVRLLRRIAVSGRPGRHLSHQRRHHRPGGQGRGRGRCLVFLVGRQLRQQERQHIGNVGRRLSSTAARPPDH